MESLQATKATFMLGLEPMAGACLTKTKHMDRSYRSQAAILLLFLLLALAG